MEYEEPQPISHAELITGLTSNDPNIIQESLVSLALHNPDFSFCWTTITPFTKHSIAAVRQVAFTCLGHLARLHRQLDAEQFIDLILHGLSDTETYVRGCAENALSDAGVFVPGFKRTALKHGLRKYL